MPSKCSEKSLTEWPPHGADPPTRTSLEETARKSQKAHNNSGEPIVLPSKILAVEPDPRGAGCIYVAESGGTVRRVVLEVCKRLSRDWFCYL